MIYEKNFFLQKLEGAAPLTQSDISTPAISLLLGHLIKCTASEKSNVWACKSKARSRGREVARVPSAARVLGVPFKGVCCVSWRLRAREMAHVAASAKCKNPLCKAEGAFREQLTPSPVSRAGSPEVGMSSSSWRLPSMDTVPAPWLIACSRPGEGLAPS